MSNNLDHFMQRFIHANKQKTKQQQAVQSSQHVQQVQNVNSNVITTATTTKSATTQLLPDEQYKVSIITLAIAHIKKRWSNAQ